jgi:predicted transcriptional regulator
MVVDRREEFKKLLKDNNLTITDFANITNMPYTTVYKWTNGEVRTSPLGIEYLKLLKEYKKIKEGKE